MNVNDMRLEFTLVENQNYVPEGDRIVIRGEVHQWSKVAPKDYREYLAAQESLRKLAREFSQRSQILQRKMESLVEFTLKKYPGV